MSFWRSQEYPLRPASPREVAKGTWDDVNSLAGFYLDALFHRNPAIMYGTVAVSMYGFGFGSAYLAGTGSRMAHWMGRTAVTQFARGSAGILGTAAGATFYGVLGTYYLGRNISHAIDPIHGESRFHESLVDPLGSMQTTQMNLMTGLNPYGNTKGSHLGAALMGIYQQYF